MHAKTQDYDVSEWSISSSCLQAVEAPPLLLLRLLRCDNRPWSPGTVTSVYSYLYCSPQRSLAGVLIKRVVMVITWLSKVPALQIIVSKLSTYSLKFNQMKQLAVLMLSYLLCMVEFTVLLTPRVKHILPQAKWLQNHNEMAETGD